MIILYVFCGLVFCVQVAFSVILYIDCRRVKKALLEVVGPELEIQKNEIIKIKKKL